MRKLETLLTGAGWAVRPDVLSIPQTQPDDTDRRIPSFGDATTTREAMVVPLDSWLENDVLERTVALHRQAGHRLILILPAPTDGNARQLRRGLARALRAGIDDFVLESAGGQELSLRLAAVSRRARARPPAHTRLVQGLEVDRSRRVLRFGARTVLLTPCEFRVFSCLLKHAGRAVTRAHIQRHLAGQSRSATTNLVDVYVLYLRRKLAQLDPAYAINTVRGVGYSLLLE